MDGSVFAGQMDRLAPQFRCLAPDLPGHGQSRHLPPNIPRSAEAVNRMIEDLGLDDVVLVGWSMGALVAWRYLARFGQGNIAGLVTVDMSPKIANGPEWSYGLLRETRRDAADPSHRTDWNKRANAIVSGMFSDASSNDGKPVEQARSLILNQNAGMMRAMWASMMKSDERSLIPNLRLPWLICYGMHSQIYPRQVRKWMLERAPQARALGFSESGHSPHLEEPATFAQAIIRFADGLPKATSPEQAVGRA